MQSHAASIVAPKKPAIFRKKIDLASELKFVCDLLLLRIAFIGETRESRIGLFNDWLKFKNALPKKDIKLTDFRFFEEYTPSPKDKAFLYSIVRSDYLSEVASLFATRQNRNVVNSFAEHLIKTLENWFIETPDDDIITSVESTIGKLENSVNLKSLYNTFNYFKIHLRDTYSQVHRQDSAGREIQIYAAKTFFFGIKKGPEERRITGDRSRGLIKDTLTPTSILYLLVLGLAFSSNSNIAKFLVFAVCFIIKSDLISTVIRTATITQESSQKNFNLLLEQSTSGSMSILESILTNLLTQFIDKVPARQTYTGDDFPLADHLIEIRNALASSRTRSNEIGEKEEETLRRSTASKTKTPAAALPSPVTIQAEPKKPESIIQSADGSTYYRVNQGHRFFRLHREFKNEFNIPTDFNAFITLARTELESGKAVIQKHDESELKKHGTHKWRLSDRRLKNPRLVANLRPVTANEKALLGDEIEEVLSPAFAAPHNKRAFKS